MKLPKISNKPNKAGQPGKLAVGLLLAGCGWMLVSCASLRNHDSGPHYATVTVNNVEPRRDLDGNIMDAHDGCLQFFDGRYYLYGTAYGKTAGFGINNRYCVYSSSDLMHWTFEGELLKSPPTGTYYRPYVVYNWLTRKYVLWYNWYPRLWDGQNAVAVSDTPTGPFQIVNADVHLTQSQQHPGDGSLFVDDDGTGYFIYTVIDQNHSIRVEKLTPDYLASVGEVSAVLGENCEAPVMFRRQNTYYALFDNCCCFCSQGSGARVYTAASPLGPFMLRNNINRNATNGDPIVPAQQTWVAQIPTPAGTDYVWMGDCWGSRPDGIKGHDFQYWSVPLAFAADGSIRPLEFSPEWRATIAVSIQPPPCHTIYVWPHQINPHPLNTDPCSGRPLSPEEGQ